MPSDNDADEGLAPVQRDMNSPVLARAPALFQGDSGRKLSLAAAFVKTPLAILMITARE